MVLDSRGIEYNPFLSSVGCPDGAVFQVVVICKDEDDKDVEACDMIASALAASNYMKSTG